MKKRWYDYLWIASSVYFLLGFVNILFAWLGLVCFFLPLIISVAGLQSLLWARSTVCAVGRAAWPFPEKGSAKISAQQVVPLWLPDFFLHNVFPDAVEHVAGV